jgi:hypothetical protein
MSQVSFLNQSTYRILVYKYKLFAIPVGVIICCIILFVVVLVPQIRQWYATQQQIALSEQRLEVLTENLNLANKIDGIAADQYLQLVSKALPSDKDFVDILNAISNAAIEALTPLNDYGFAVGNLSGDAQSIQSSLPVTITIGGGLADVRRFAVSLQHQLPLSDITEIHIGANNTAQLTINFYYKPFPKTLSFQPAKPLQTLSPQEQALMDKIRTIEMSSKQSTLLLQRQLIQQ